MTFVRICLTYYTRFRSVQFDRYSGPPGERRAQRTCGPRLAIDRATRCERTTLSWRRATGPGCHGRALALSTLQWAILATGSHCRVCMQFCWLDDVTSWVDGVIAARQPASRGDNARGNFIFYARRAGERASARHGGCRTWLSDVALDSTLARGPSPKSTSARDAAETKASARAATEQPDRARHEPHPRRERAAEGRAALWRVVQAVKGARVPVRPQRRWRRVVDE